MKSFPNRARMIVGTPRAGPLRPRPPCPHPAPGAAIDDLRAKRQLAAFIEAAMKRHDGGVEAKRASTCATRIATAVAGVAEGKPWH